MSQQDVLKILKELKGEATTKEISDKAKEKYPKRTLYTYVWTRLTQLEKNRKVERTGSLWKLKSKK